MDSVSIVEFEKSAQTVKYILILLVGLCIYRLVIGSNISESIIILCTSIAGLICISKLIKIATKKIENESFRMSILQSTIIGIILVICLGSLSCYLFFFKGIYGLYRLFYEFSFGSLIYRLIIFYYAIILGKSLSNLHTVFNSIKNGNSINYNYKKD